MSMESTKRMVRIGIARHLRNTGRVAAVTLMVAIGAAGAYGQTIPPGYDLFETPAGSTQVTIGGTSQIPEIPANFFFEGSEAWSGVIGLRGEPLPGYCGAVNTVIERKQEAIMPGPATVEVELKELDLVSTAPIEVGDGGGGIHTYDVAITVNPTVASVGFMTIEDTVAGGQVYDFRGRQNGGVNLYARFIFFEAWPSRGVTPPPIVWDPPDPLLLESVAPQPWQYEEPADACVHASDFYPLPGIAVQTVLDGGDSGEHWIIGPRPVDGCCLADGICIEVDPLDCANLGGVPQGGPCAFAISACCLPDGSCLEVDPVCCDDLGGEPSPTGQPTCLGDANGNGIDDACEPDAVVIPAGTDYFETTVGSTRVHLGGASVIPEIPADFFFEGSLPWSGTVELRGDPLPGRVGAVSAIIERKEAAVMPGPATVEVELKELSLASVEPIVVSDGLGGEYQYILKMKHDMAMASVGSMTITETVSDGGGIYDFRGPQNGITLYVELHFFEAWPSRNRDPLIILPPPLLLESVGVGMWQYEEPEIVGESGNGFYQVPGEELLTVVDGGASGEHGVIPPHEVEACCLQGGACIVVTPEDCLALGGKLSPTREPVCLGDGNGNGVDDACEPPEVIPAGDIYLETVAGTSWVEFGGESELPPIPAGMFFAGSQPYEGVVELKSGGAIDWEEVKPYSWPDVIVEREQAAILSSGSAEIEIELKELNLASVAPITVTDSSIPPTEYEYNLLVTLNDNPGYESKGSMLIVTTDDYGGVYHLDAAHGGGVNVYARFNFFEAWPSRNGEPVVWDPPDPLLLETTGAAPWQYAKPEGLEELYVYGSQPAPLDQGPFYPVPGEEVQGVLDGGASGEHGVIPPRPREGCCMPEGACLDINANDCAILGGTPQGVPCTQTTIACCLDPLEDPDCLTIDPLCCDDVGGNPSPTGVPGCQSDGNGNGRDDACEVPTVIPIGTDYWETTPGSTRVVLGGTSQIPAIPAGYFFAGSQPWEGTIELTGDRRTTSGNWWGDAVIERKEEADIGGGPDTIEVELKELNLVSTAPITVTDDQHPPGEYYYDVTVTLNDTAGYESTGYVTITPVDAYGGTFEFDAASGGGIDVYARFNFFEAWPSRRGARDYPDPWDPPDPLLMESVAPHRYQYADPQLIDNPNNDFYAPPERELEVELDGGDSGYHGVIPARRIHACCYDDGTCEDLTVEDCQANDGTPVEGVGCDEIGCLVHVQACCYPNGTCEDAVAADCTANGGKPLGYGTSCSGDADADGFDDVCEVACCISEGVICITTSLDWCAGGWEGVSRGYCTHCLGDNDLDGPDDACEAPVITPGHDYWATVAPTTVIFGMGGALPPIPADFFFSGSLPWEGTIDLMGEPLDELNLGNASTIVKRNCTGLLAQPSLSDVVQIELVEMQLKSTAPIEVGDIGSPVPVYYDVTVTLDSDHPSVGEMTITSEDETGDNGVYGNVFIPIWPLFEFAPAGGGGAGGGAYVVDEELALTGSGPYPWQAQPLLDPPLPGSGPDFYPTGAMELDLIVATDPIPDPVGSHGNEPPGLGCCLPGAVCINLEPNHCLDLLGVPQPSPCTGTMRACCLDPALDPDCIDGDPICCDEEGGTPAIHDTVCRGDANGNGQDDACEPPSIIPVGFDHFETKAGSSWVKFGGESSVPPLPADFFFLGSQPYEGIVELRGDPPPDACAAVDVIVERKEEADLSSGSAMVEVELKELSLVSTAPITVTDGQGAEYGYDVGVTISPDTPSIGQMLIVGIDAGGGVYEMSAAQGGGIYIYARFNFFEAWPSRADPIVWDPPDPLLLESVAPQAYQYAEPPITCASGNDFYSVPEQVLLTLLDGGITGEHGVIPPRIPEACCLPDGKCVDIDPGDCVILGGNPQGPGSMCTAREACCLDEGACEDLDPLCCAAVGGTPQGPGTGCVDCTIACCLEPTEDPNCVTTDPICCDDQGGNPSPSGEPMCLGDGNGNGVDDACEEVCQPDETGQACTIVICPDPTDECVPTVVRRNAPGPYFPIGGIDVLTPTTGSLEIEDPDGGTEVYTIVGDVQPNITRIVRGDPEDVGGHREIDMHVTDMELVAGGGGGGGAIAIHLSTAQASTGQVIGSSAVVSDFPADSFFDVYVTVDILDLPGAAGLYHDEPIPLSAYGINSVPPWGRSFETRADWTGVELLDATGLPTGYTIRRVVHVVPPPPPPWEVVVCECLPPDACHVEFDAGGDQAYCVGICPPGTVCKLIRRDANGDGLEDTFECICVPLGACCLADHTCLEMTEADCLELGAYQGDFTMCGGMEACCAPIGKGTGCTDADALCCVNELGGTPQGPGTACANDQACCLPNGDCVMIDPLCCVSELAGTPVGPGSVCTAREACCLDDGSCEDLDPLCCAALGGTPQGPGTGCVDCTIACCLEPTEDPNCVTTDPICCDDQGGSPSPSGEPMCLGDGSGNGIDDACEELCEPDETGQACTPVLCPVPDDECVPWVVRRNAAGPLFPIGGVDVLTPTTGWIEMHHPPDPADIYTITGQVMPNLTRISRGDPEDMGGHREVQMQIIEMELVAGAAGGGSILIHQSAVNPSLGSISGASVPDTDYPAESFFDVFVTVDITDVPGAEGLWHEYPIPLMSSGDTSVPPWGSTLETPFGGWPGAELLDAGGDPTGYWIRHVAHVVPPSPPQWEVVECKCLPPDACHVEFDEIGDYAYCVGVCPPGTVCNLIGTDTNGDGLDDEFTCVCEAPGGACCLEDFTCIQTTEADCLGQGGTYEGDGTVCEGMEACCLPIDRGTACVNADALCCRLHAGTPQGPGTACTPDEACCWGDGFCEMLDPLCCVSELNGTPLGPGSICTAREGCCLDEGLCRDFDPLCCLVWGGAPQGAGTGCVDCTIACCVPGGGCEDADPLCCDDLEGFVSPYASACLGDLNGNGIDDACEPPPDPPVVVSYPYNRTTNAYFAFGSNISPERGARTANIAYKVELTSLVLGSCAISGAPCRLDVLECDGDGAPCTVDADCTGHGGSELCIASDCGQCSDPATDIKCLTAPLNCPPGETCDLTGETCVNDQAGSTGMTWWVGAESPLDNDVHLLVSLAYRKVSTDWPAVVYVADCEVVPCAEYRVRKVDVDAGRESAPLDISTIGRPGSNYWADCVGPLGDYCVGNWRPCTSDADCPFCYDADDPPSSSLTPCVTDDDCDPETTGEYCGTVCIEQWPPPDAFTNFHDVTAAVFGFTQLPGLTIPDIPWSDVHGNDGGDETVDPPNFVINFADISAIVNAFQGWPYPYADPADCPDIGIWPPYPKVIDCSNSGCLGGARDQEPDEPCVEPDSFTFTPGPGSLHVLHEDATYNCCPDDIVITASLEGTTLHLRETEILTVPCDCMCCYNVEATVVGLAPGEYLVEFCWLDWELGGEQCYMEMVVIP